MQHLLPWAKDRCAIDVSVHAALEPELPYALHRACLLQPRISCQVIAHTALQPYQAFTGRGKALDDISGYTVSMESKNFDAQALAIVNCLRDQYLPLLGACSSLPGFLRTTQDAGGLPGRLQCSRAWLALAHWAGADGVQAHAEAVMERHVMPKPRNAHLAVPTRRRARRMSERSALRGTWRLLPTPAAEIWALAWPRLLALARAQGFVMSEPEPRCFRLERLLPEVRQWVQFRLGDTSVACALRLGTPVLRVRWKALLAPFGQGRSPRGQPFEEGKLLPDRLDEFDIDRQDLGFGTDRGDFLAGVALRRAAPGRRRRGRSGRVGDAGRSAMKACLACDPTSPSASGDPPPIPGRMPAAASACPTLRFGPDRAGSSCCPAFAGRSSPCCQQHRHCRASGRVPLS